MAEAATPTGTVEVEVEVPEGAKVGDRLSFNTAAGKFELVVPSGTAPGNKMSVTMPVLNNSQPASPTKAASKKKSAASPMKRPSMAKLGRLLSFSKRGEERSTAALVVEEAVEEAVRAPSPTTAVALEETPDEYDAEVAAVDQAEAAAAAAAAAAAEAIDKQKVAEEAEAAAAKAAATLAAAEEEAARAEVRKSAASESAEWVSSINTMVASGWEEWTSGREATAKRASATSAAAQAGSAAAAAQEARLEAEESRRKADSGRQALRKAELKAWLNQHQGLLLLALLLTVWALVSYSGLLTLALALARARAL